MACRDLDFLWKEFSRDPSQFRDHRNSKRGPRSPDFRHKQTREPLWVDGWRNPPWVKEELRRSGVRDEELCVQGRPFLDRTALFDLIKACGKEKDLCKGSSLHADILESGLLKNDISLGNALLTMYGKCGALSKAQEMFNGLSARNIVTWNALISAYVYHGLGNEAWSCFERLQSEGLSPDAVTFICILKACGSIGAVDKGEEIHAEVGRHGLLKKDIVLGTALVDMYAKCGALAKAQGVFDKLPSRDVVTWNALIAGYAQLGLGDEALCYFRRMRDEGLSPNRVTYICILKACGSIAATEKGEEIHAEVHRQGLLEKDIVLGNALVDMYVKCGAFAKAQDVFDELPARNVATWTSLIAGYAQHGLSDEALSCFERMQDEGLSPNAITFICTLKACISVGAVKLGEEIHDEINKQHLLEKDNVLGTTLVDMYAKCGALGKAQEVFDKLPARNLVTWNALIGGYAQHMLGDEAWSCFERMLDEGHSPDAITFISILKACGSIGAAKKGEEIHAELSRQGLLEEDIILDTALVDMYAKCGELVNAQEVFDKLSTQGVAAWTALISGYAQIGKVKMVFDSFIKMIRGGLEPDSITFVVLLTACSHAGLVEEGQRYFDTMSTIYSIIPTLEHHLCMVDLLSRAGHFHQAICIIEKVPPCDYLLLWSALMGACPKWGNVEFGRWVFNHAVQLDEKFATAYVCMSNMYADAGMLDEADEIEALRKKNGAWKLPGCCWWTDQSRNVHPFTAGDENHPKSKSFYEKLKSIGQKLQLEGYFPLSHWLSEATLDDEKEGGLCRHIEKSAITSALISTPEGTPIRVTKNIRVCNDCHFAASLISKMEKRRIHVKDANCIHVFEDGKCICED